MIGIYMIFYSVKVTRNLTLRRIQKIGIAG